MGTLLTTTGNLPELPALFAPEENAARRFVEFFTANIRNPNTRRAYARTAAEFAQWCELHGIRTLAAVGPVHVAAYIETMQERLSAPSVKQRLAALRRLFDWLVVGQVLPINPASSVRGPKHSARRGSTPVLSAEEARTLLDSISPATIAGLRDRALIALMVYTFARVGAVIKMRSEDVYVQARRHWVRLHEKGGKRHEMPCHHKLEDMLDAYLAAAVAPPRSHLFRSMDRSTNRLSDVPMSSALQNPCNPHEHWRCGVNADGRNSRERIQWRAVPESFRPRHDGH